MSTNKVIDGLLIECKRKSATIDELRAALSDVMQFCVTPNGMPDKDKGRTPAQQAAYDNARTLLKKLDYLVLPK